ncbi:MAG: hypothetical protein RIM23_06580 [Coleofasciculus sp. G3-WIS-01]|uniref:hypothetical protein n=1 Tax=Coleofasciculus sp. G3-WIS-01 TaxID=3069528 RepID=UPI0032F87195
MLSLPWQHQSKGNGSNQNKFTLTDSRLGVDAEDAFGFNELSASSALAYLTDLMALGLNLYPDLRLNSSLHGILEKLMLRLVNGASHLVTAMIEVGDQVQFPS